MTEHWPTYLLLALYVTAMTTVTIIANKQNKKSDESTNNNMVSTHFLASKSFGTLTLLLTTFASIFSGYTLVGVPDEAGNDGFIAIRWVVIGLFGSVSFLIIFPRIRRLSVERKYQSPGDFINDRFQSKPLSALIALCLCVPQLLYLGVQLFSLGIILSSLTNNQLSFYSIIIVSALLILVFEVFGGMRSVAYTDAVQSTIMILVFLAIPIVVAIQYGGFMGQVTNPNDLPCNNSNADRTSGCLNYETNGIAKEYFLRTPSVLTIINYILFMFSGLSFSLNPHILQRCFAAKQDKQLRFVMICMYFAVFLCQIPGLLTGITYISNKTEYESKGTGAFEAILAVFRDQGGFTSFVSYIALLAGIAGIMSTADSSLIGVSNTISCNIFKNWLYPNISAQKIVYIGKAISIITMSLSLVIAIYIYLTNTDYGVLVVVQAGLLWQALPSYLFGLYTNIHKRSVLFGVIIGIITDIILIGAVFTDNDPIILITGNQSLANLDKSWSAYVGVIFNLIACYIGHVCFKWQSIDNDMFVSKLSIDNIKRIMKGTSEPIMKYYGIFIWFSCIFFIVGIFHMFGAVDPKLVEEYGLETVRTFTYNGYIDSVIVGLPSWTFAIIIWNAIGCICGILATLTWRVDTTENKSELFIDEYDLEYDGSIQSKSKIPTKSIQKSNIKSYTKISSQK
eukprot:233997_1